MDIIRRCARTAFCFSMLVAVVGAALVGATPPAAAQQHGKVAMDPAAREHLDKGLEYYGQREYEAALVEFKAGYEIDARPEFLFAMAQAERLSGDCGSAVVLYREFLATDPPAMHAEAARGSLSKCETALASRPEGSSAPVGVPMASEPRPEDEAELAPDRNDPGGAGAASLGSRPLADSDAGPWYRDTVGVTLLGLGVAGIGVGATFTALSFSAESAADNASSYQEYEDSLDKAESRRAVGFAALGIGVALATGAAVKYFVLDGRDRRTARRAHRDPRDSTTSTSVAVLPANQGAALVWSGRW